MDDSDKLFPPNLAEAFKKLDPEDGEQILEYIKTQAMLSREKALLQSSVRDQRKLLVENGKLKKDIEDLRVELKDKKKKRVAKALFAPVPVSPAPDVTSSNQSGASTSTANQSGSTVNSHRDRQSRRRRGGGEGKARPSSASLSLEAGLNNVDVSRLELRVGRIVSARVHPLAQNMALQEVDVGEEKTRRVVRKLTTDLDQLPGVMAVLLCNVKPFRLKGIVSQARLLVCSAPSVPSDVTPTNSAPSASSDITPTDSAPSVPSDITPINSAPSSDDITELLAPPPGSTPGDRVTFLNYPGESDRELQPKQRVWECVQPDFRVDGRGVANYKGCGFEVKGKGLCRAPTLTNCSII